MIDTPAHRKAVFLDRDGTIIVERDFLGDPDGVELLPRAAQAVRLFNDWGYLVFGISKQSGVARGYFGTDEVEAVNARVMSEVAAEAGGRIERIYYCPHHPEADRPEYRTDCACRKPKPGLILEAAREHSIDLSSAVMIGDQPADIVAGHAAGLPAVFLLTGYGAGMRAALPAAGNGAPDHIAPDLYEATLWFGRRIGAIGA